MGVFNKKKLTIITVVYWFLLVYIVAALVWWFIALFQQNRQMAQYKLQELVVSDPAYLQKASAITAAEKRKQAQYIGEGATFLFLIFVGAIFVYRAVKKQLKATQQQQNFMMAVTHEFKTPIAITRLNLETLQKHKLDETRQQKLIQSSLQETNRLNTLANNILISSQLDGGGYTLAKEELDFSLLANRCIAAFKTRFTDRPIQTVIDNELDISGDTLLLEIIINNLLENAVKYSPKNSTIHFSLKQLGSTIQLQVADNGIGIPKEERTKIFDRFYRVGNEQVRNTKGTGLGLYLCKKIASDHNGDIQVTENNPTGSIFTVQFNR
jgi:two-component system, OmpR family, sensor histidine kinase CiaH